MKWNPNEQYFASGGNDNKTMVFSTKLEKPIMTNKNKAAIRAIEWSKTKWNVLMTGGGTADRRIRVWDI